MTASLNKLGKKLPPKRAMVTSSVLKRNPLPLQSSYVKHTEISMIAKHSPDATEIYT